MKQYANRNVIAQGDYYMRHVQAMTAEGLHNKGDIAAELAHRDEMIDVLKTALEACLQYGSMTGDEWVTDQTRAALAKAK